MSGKELEKIMTIPMKAIKLYEKAKKHIENDRKLISDMLWNPEEVSKTVSLLVQALKIAPNYSEVRSTLDYVTKMAGLCNEHLGDVISSVLKKQGKEIPIKAKQLLEEVKKKAKESRLKSERDDVYKLFRKFQERAKENAKIYLNDEFYKLTSYADLTNIDIIIDYVKNSIKRYPNDELLLKSLETLEVYKKYALWYVPFLIQRKIKSTIIDLGIKYKYNRIHASEIAEKCKEPEDIIILLIREMIETKEIFGEFFSSTKSLIFNQQANIDNVDNIMKNIEKWETQFCKECGMKIIEVDQKICEHCGNNLSN